MWKMDKVAPITVDLKMFRADKNNQNKDDIKVLVIGLAVTVFIFYTAPTVLHDNTPEILTETVKE